MNAAIEFHDSTVSEISVFDGTAIVHFNPAYIHKSDGRPGRDAGTGWLHEARLLVEAAVVIGDSPDFPCKIASGEVLENGNRHDGLIQLPFETNSAVEVRLLWATSDSTSIKGSRARVELVGEPRLVEEYK